MPAWSAERQPHTKARQHALRGPLQRWGLYLLAALALVLLLPCSASALSRSPSPSPPALRLDNPSFGTIALWPYLRVYTADLAGELTPAQASDRFLAGEGTPVQHDDDDFGRIRHPVWTEFSLANVSGSRIEFVLITRQTTIEVLQLYQWKEEGWQRVPGRHETATGAFERDRSPSFLIEMGPGVTRRYLLRTETAGPIKFLFKVQTLANYLAEDRAEHFFVVLTYSLPLALLLVIGLMRRIEGVGSDPLFVAMVITDLVASAWLIGLAPQLFPTIDPWAYRVMGQMSYGLLAFFLCWHERRFLALDRHVPLGASLLRVQGWLAVITVPVLLLIDRRLGAEGTLAVSVLTVLLCMGVALVALRRRVRYSLTYVLALALYLASGLAYVMYQLRLMPMQVFGLLALVQGAGVCIVMSVAVARSLLARDQRLSMALQEADAQRREAQRLSREHDRLYAAANHDLRQPLQAVALNLELLRQQPVSAEQAIIMARMRLAVASMSNMLGSFLDLDRASRDDAPVPLQPVPLGPLIARLALEYREHARAKGLSLKVVATSAQVLSDALLLERVIRNLLANALRYTDRGRVLVGVRRRGDRLCLVVLDSGRGIEPERVARLLDGDAGGRDPQGAPRSGESYGLGLQIVKTICARIDARIEVRSQPGKGSCFQVILPRHWVLPPRANALPGRVPPALASSEHKPGPPALSGLRVLLLDDDALILGSLVTYLETLGAQVTPCQDAASALAMLESPAQWDAVICDWDLGAVPGIGLDGRDVLLIACRRHPQARRVLISGRIVPGNPVPGLPPETLCLAKPMTPEQLAHALAPAGPLR